MSETIQGMKRTMLCAELSVENIGENVTLMGWCHKKRDLGGLTFISLRDRSGEIQLVVSTDSPQEVIDKSTDVKSEFVIACQGTVCKRSAPNSKQKTGDIEVAVSVLRILSESKTPPFYIEENVDANEALRLKHRYLDLRRPDLQRNLILRHRIAKTARDYFDQNGFLEIETPMLGKSTPEGARDYLVPSRVKKGSFFALAQSPQLYKQLLMVSGCDRYMQIVKCFRDEDLRADRQPEFTQIDLEMSFVDREDVMAVTEGFLATAFKEALCVDVPLPLPRMPWREAMDRFGSDKPDLRFGMEIKNISDFAGKIGFPVFAGALENGGSVRGICVKGGAALTRKEIDSLGEYVKTYRAKGLAWLCPSETPRSSFLKFLDAEGIQSMAAALDAGPEDLMLFVADKDEVVFDALGALRCEVAKRRGLIDEKENAFLWVTDFPLFEYDEEENRYVAKHHPFTSPMDEDIALLETDPGAVRAKAYDVILNGTELGGGSIRIHDQAMQEKMFSLLGFSPESAYEQFGFLLDAFQYGVPPHGGLAIGLDRLVMLMTGSKSLRDVIAFPKVQNSSDLMTQAPAPVAPKQLDDLGVIMTTDINSAEEDSGDIL